VRPLEKSIGQPIRFIRKSWGRNSRIREHPESTWSCAIATDEIVVARGHGGLIVDRGLDGGDAVLVGDGKGDRRALITGEKPLLSGGAGTDTVTMNVSAACRSAEATHPPGSRSPSSVFPKLNCRTRRWPTRAGHYTTRRSSCGTRRCLTGCADGCGNRPRTSTRRMRRRIAGPLKCGTTRDRRQRMSRPRPRYPSHAETELSSCLG
jgi:hypothetical protein